jgi:hypothetical protein
VFRRILALFNIGAVAFFLKSHPEISLRCPHGDDQLLKKGIIGTCHTRAVSDLDRFQISAPSSGQKAAEELAPSYPLLGCQEMLGYRGLLLILDLGKWRTGAGVNSEEEGC